MEQDLRVPHQHRQEVQREQRLDLVHTIIYESVCQSRHSANHANWSFLIALIMTTAGTLIGLGGASLLLLGKTSEGTVTTAVGLASGVYSYQMSKEAAERQKQANEQLRQMLQFLQGDNP